MELETNFNLNENYEKYILKGMYPQVWDRNIEPNNYYLQYIQTYIERDVRNINNIYNLNLFTKFIQLSAGRAGQIINYTSLANYTGVDVKTIQN